jgi:heme/copper-type cytochrome/quinol oxidase subunit 2
LAGADIRFLYPPPSNRDIYIPLQENPDWSTCMNATLLDLLMILSLGILAGTVTGLVIGFAVKKQKRDWSAMTAKDKTTTVLLILACSSIAVAALSWYLFQYSVT